MDAGDRELGLGRAISRRDFLNGAAVGGAAALLLPRWLEALERAEDQPGRVPYPPALAGLRGSHAGSFEVAHALADGSFWRTAGEPLDTGERYDLVVIGAGLSGLSAARFYQQRLGRGARILLLDNHDDFGGHAKRNEFTAAGRLLLGYGGTFSIDSPAPYSPVARGLIAELGIDVASFRRHVDTQRDAHLGRGLFFDKETFGADRLLPSPLGARGERGPGTTAAAAWRRFRAEAPLPEAARQDLERLCSERRDYLPGLDAQAKKLRLRDMSYASYLSDVVRCDLGVLKVLQTRPHGLYGVGIDALPAQDAWGLGFPGFQGLGLDPAPGLGMNRDSVRSAEAERYYFHFPDGNATLARLLVRDLVPGALPGASAEDAVTARADYARLDRDGAPVRVRLLSTAVRVRHVGAHPGQGDVEVAYVQGGRLAQVQARHCVLACWHVLVPHLFPELPDEQKRALADMVKVPIVYTNAVLRRFAPFRRLGVRGVDAPGSYWSELNADAPVSVGAYRAPVRPDEPVVVHLMRTPCAPGKPARDQHRAGRLELFTTEFATFERAVRDQLARVLGPGGFDPATDILGLTVNRWPHGYAYQYNSLWDPFWREGRLDQQPCLAARRPFGGVAIANADAGAYAYTDGAIDQAYRAVAELLGGPGGPA